MKKKKQIQQQTNEINSKNKICAWHTKIKN